MTWDLSSTSVVILGAGFSVAATEGRAPLMRTFFDSLDPKQFPLLHEFVDFVAGGTGDVRDANVESVLLSLEQIRRSPLSVVKGWAEQWKENATTVTRQLSAYTINRLRTCQAVPGNWAVRLLEQCGPRTTVISMNYDNLAESILSGRPGTVHFGPGLTCPHCKMRMILELACSCTGRAGLVDRDWTGAVLKPHGSIAWRRCTNTACCSFECMVADIHCRPFEPCACPNCNDPCCPVLVMPAMSKNLEDTPEIGVMWQAAQKAIAAADSVLLFGFSLPASDELLLQMVRASVHANKRLRRVGAIDLEPEAVMDRFARCIPAGLTPEIIHLRVVPDQVPEWAIA